MDIASKSKRQLEECVLRILEHGDLNQMTERTVCSLAQKETGFDLMMDKVNRAVVKQVMQDFFAMGCEMHEAPQEHNYLLHDVNCNKVALDKPAAAKQPPSKPKRRLILLATSDDEEVEEKEAKPGPEFERPVAQTLARNDVDKEEPGEELKAAAAAKKGDVQNSRKMGISGKAIQTDKKVASHKPAMTKQPLAKSKCKPIIPVDGNKEAEEEAAKDAKPNTKGPIAHLQALARSGRGGIEITVSNDECKEKSVEKLKVEVAAKKDVVQNSRKMEISGKAIETDKRAAPHKPATTKQRAPKPQLKPIIPMDDNKEPEEEATKAAKAEPKRPIAAIKGVVQSSGNKVIRRKAIKTDVEHENAKREDTFKSQNVLKRKRSSEPSMTTTAKAANDTHKEEGLQRRVVPPQKCTSQRPARSRLSTLDIDKLDVNNCPDEEGPEGKRVGPRNSIFTSVLKPEHMQIVKDSEDKEVVRERSPKKWQTKGNVICCQLSKLRSAAIQVLENKIFISIREYYEKGGEMLPCFEGISLPMEEWETVKEGIPEIEAAIRRLKR